MSDRLGGPATLCFGVVGSSQAESVLVFRCTEQTPCFWRTPTPLQRAVSRPQSRISVLRSLPHRRCERPARLGVERGTPSKPKYTADMYVTRESHKVTIP